MATSLSPEERLVSLFAQTPCWMIQPLAAEMDYSIPSVRRFLSGLGYYSSFTHNGKWYTIRSIPRFGRNGLCFYRGIGFSRAGTLTNTLVALITRSPAGMTAEIVGKTLRCRCHGAVLALPPNERKVVRMIRRVRRIVSKVSSEVPFRQTSLLCSEKVLPFFRPFCSIS